jgi:hypothetical protein
MHSFKYFLEATKRTGCTCWTGYKRVPGTKPCSPGSCVKEEADKLKGTPVVSLGDFDDKDNTKNKYGQTVPKKLKKNDPRVKFHKEPEKNGVAEELSVDEQFDIIEEIVNDLSQLHNLDPEYIWEKFEQLSDQELLEYAVDAKGHKSSTGGLTQKGRDAYNREEGSNLKAPVTKPPSELKKGSKAYNRRKSFCARMSGVEGPMKKPNGEPTRKALALRKWNC